MEKVRDRSGILSSRSRTPLPKLMQSCQSFYAICNRISLQRRGATLPSPPPSTTGLPIDSTWLRLKTSLFFYSPLSSRRWSSSASLAHFRSIREKEKCPEIFFHPPFSLPPWRLFLRYSFPWSQYSPDTTEFSLFSVIKPVVYGLNSSSWDHESFGCIPIELINFLSIVYMRIRTKGCFINGSPFSRDLLKLISENYP